MGIMKSGLGLGATGALLAAALMSTAQANVIFSASGNTIGPNSVAATAEFSISGNTLTITLTNTSPANAQEAPGSTLTGLSFLLAGGDSIALLPVSASSPHAIVNSAECNVTACGNVPQNVGGEWGFQSNFTLGTGTGHYAAGGVGFITTGLAGDIGNFNNGAAGTDLEGPASLNGIEFGILSNLHGPLNPGAISNSALIQNDIILTLTGVSGISENQITGVNFLYGTSATDITTIPGSCRGSNNCGDQFAPEPGSLALIGLALSGLALARRRWQK